MSFILSRFILAFVSVPWKKMCVAVVCPVLHGLESLFHLIKLAVRRMCSYISYREHQWNGESETCSLNNCVSESIV